jgi:manganese efflux pump family protein
MPVLLLVGVLGPLALDTFVLAAALGVVGLDRKDRLRVSIVLALFEGGMPIVGFLIGGAIGHVVGQFAGYAAIFFLAVAGVLLLRPGEDEEREKRKLALLARARGVAVIDLGLSISIDELAIGFSLGLLGVSLPVAVIWIAVQAFAAAQLGMRMGGRIGDELRERGEQLAGLVLLGMAALLLVLRVTAHL